MKTYQLNLSDSRGKILAVVKEKWLPKDDKDKLKEVENQEFEEENGGDFKSPCTANYKIQQKCSENKRKLK